MLNYQRVTNQHGDLRKQNMRWSTHWCWKKPCSDELNHHIFPKESQWDYPSNGTIHIPIQISHFINRYIHCIIKKVYILYVCIFMYLKYVYICNVYIYKHIIYICPIQWQSRTPWGPQWSQSQWTCCSPNRPSADSLMDLAGDEPLIFFGGLGFKEW